MALGVVSKVRRGPSALLGSTRIARLAALAAVFVGTTACGPNATSGGDEVLGDLIPELRDMAFIPGGRLDSLFEEASRVDIAPFFVDRFETTNEEFAEFVRSPRFAAGSPFTLSNWSRGANGLRVPRGREHHPVVWVTYGDALAYAQFRGKRLPTELEWRAAARKYSDARYPWGQGFSSNRCNSLACGINDTTIVGTFESGENDWGCYDFAGNVWEIVDSSPPGVSAKLILGGAFRSTPEQCAIPDVDEKRWARDLRKQVIGPTELQFDVGFRCVRDLTPELLERIEHAARVGDAEVKAYCEPILRMVRSVADKATADAPQGIR
ncbi:MAG: SUMF1/EgtB/PvdO family nonheme iron enzyme [Planctomycetes bacterium]|nr:SUMF1/EgtB/PvdO family nonheme iron enzyme [Planctomycetota bacterium]MBI3844608.1 SUMF1/EgtB/PvdO family nonheme iron enzyme [Planctomycetota bacterium]